MKTFSVLTAVLFALSVVAPVYADEVGPGKPSSETTTESTTSSTDCSLIETWLGTCEDSSVTTAE